MTYFPPPDPERWGTATPAEAGLDPQVVGAAARHASEVLHLTVGSSVTVDGLVKASQGKG